MINLTINASVIILRGRAGRSTHFNKLELHDCQFPGLPPYSNIKESDEVVGMNFVDHFDVRKFHEFRETIFVIMVMVEVLVVLDSFEQYQ